MDFAWCMHVHTVDFFIIIFLSKNISIAFLLLFQTFDFRFHK